MSNQLPSEGVAIVASIDPDAYAVSTESTAWITAKNFHKFLAAIQAGDLGTGATLDANIQQAQDGAGTGAKAITGKAITQLTQAGADSNKQALINLNTEELDVDGGFGFIRLNVVIGVLTSDASALLLGVDPRYAPASDFDVASVDEIVA